jgi:N-acetylglutamate synthase-like GNAT family acetyltransferase
MSGYRMESYRATGPDESLFDVAFSGAYQHLELLQGLPYREALEAASDSTDGEPFQENVLWSPDGRLVGYAAVAMDVDIHVGECLSVIWCWVHPDHAGKTTFVQQVLGRVRLAAKELDIPYSYTRTKGFTVMTIYRGVKRG